jgi:proprotein convertase subtilisin/kexin type 5
MNPCPANYYSNKAALDAETQVGSVCSSCAENCSTCTGALDHECTSCKAAFLLQLLEGKCLSTCSDGSYPSTVNAGTCDACDDTCATCTDGKSTSCGSCKANTFLHLGSCLNTCPNGTYGDAVTRECKPCGSNCEMCSSATTCTKCRARHFVNLEGGCSGKSSMMFSPLTHTFILPPQSAILLARNAQTIQPLAMSADLHY